MQETKKKIMMAIIACVIGATCNAEAVKFGDNYMMFFEIRNDTVCLVVDLVSADLCIREDAKMLVRFGDKSVLKLEGKLKEKYLNQSVSGYHFDGAGAVDSRDRYHSQAIFTIKKEDVERFKDGVMKIRIYTSPDIYTKEWDKDKIGRKLYEQYLLQSKDVDDETF